MYHRVAFTAVLVSALGSFARAETLQVNGSTTVNLPVAEAAEILRAERKMDIQVDTQGGSSGGISMLGDGLVQVGMISKHVSDDDRGKYPTAKFKETQIGEDAVALIVSKDVWDGGVKSLSKEQFKGIYESKITNWKDVGGKPQRIAFFNKEPGRGTWEVFVHWLYGNPKSAPQVSFPEVGGNEETRNKVASTRGALSQLSSSWADGKKVFALGIKLDDGTVVESTNANIAAKKYPLFLLTNGEPSGGAKALIDFLLGQDGQELVKKHSYLREAALWMEVRERLHSPAHSLSVGQLQRLCLARTLVVKPDVILMDEPTSALDPKSTQAIEELILRLKQHHTIVLVTHNVAQARRVTDWLACICIRDGAGELVESGCCESLLNDSKCREVIEYLEHAD